VKMSGERPTSVSGFDDVAGGRRVRYSGAMGHPIHPAAVNRRIIQVPPGRTVTAQDPLRVLLAEDSMIVSKRLLSLINELGQPIRVTAVASGNEAAQLFDEMQPDVAVLDLALPGMNGFELLTSFKSRRPACIVAILTTYVHPVFREHGTRLGADFFFSKTLEFERVAQMLASLTPSSAQI
jgi:CheY-like chemotaxis protein